MDEAALKQPPARDEPQRPAADSNGDDELRFFTPRRLVQTTAVVLVLLVAIYFLLPKVAGLEDSMAKLGEAQPGWIALALAFEVLAFATYVALFRGVVGGDVLPLRWREAYQINMAGLAATRLFSAGGAGGLILVYWALRKAGMERRESATRMVAFLALQYIFYPLVLIVFGVLLRTGVLPGKSSVELTIIPAAIAGAVLILGGLLALIPEDFERRIGRVSRGARRTAMAERVATVPATVASGVRVAFDLLGHPSKGGLAVLGAAGFWAANVAILWASFQAFGVSVPFAVIVQGFFIGMVANLIPFAPGGVGAVDAGMIGAFVLFGLPDAEVFASVLIYRLVAFWLPIPFGIAAFLQLRGTVHRWEAGAGAPPARRPGMPREVALGARQYFRK